MRCNLPFYRTHLYAQSEGEPFFYQQVILHYPMLKQRFEQLRNEYGSWKEIFYAICEDEHFTMTAENLENIRRIDETVTNAEEQRVVEGALNDPITHLAAMVDRLNDEQRRVFNCLTMDMATAGNLYFVFGAAGTGKNFLLKVLSAFFEQQGVKNEVFKENKQMINETKSELSFIE
ncbi:hypothetical protein RMCBS344292_06080 [Rhizopus microsporus]|nr:hypothetical protein RMCBS344292_06080 [Rhizopus microsporus]